jgi:hypothetical protein
MKNSLLTLIGFTLLGSSPLLGQTTTVVMPAGAQTAPGAPVVIVGQDCAGCQHTKTTCVPECATKPVKKVCYSSGCEPFCLCYFQGMFAKCGCDSGHCEKPRTKRYLIKKIRVVDEEFTKCVPVEEPCCTTAAPCCTTAAPCCEQAMPMHKFKH